MSDEQGISIRFSRKHWTAENGEEQTEEKLEPLPYRQGVEMWVSIDPGDDTKSGH